MKPHIWAQLKNITADELITSLEKDGAVRVDDHGSSARVYRLKSGLKIAIHYHPHRTYDPKMISYLIEKTGWTEQDLTRLKLIR